MALAGFGAGEAEGLRRAMSRKRSEAAMAVYRERFIEGAVERGVERAVAERVFDQVTGLLRLRLPEGARRRLRPARLPVDLVARALRAGVPVRAVERAADGLLPAGRARARRAAARDDDPCSRTSTSSAVECRVEATRGAGVAATQLAVRIGLGYVLGVQEEEVRRVVDERERSGIYRGRGRAWRAVGGGARHARAAGVGGRLRGVAGRAAVVGERHGSTRRDALWQLGVVDARPCRAGRSAALAAARAAAPPPLRELTPWERLVADYGSFRISIDEHPLALMRDDLPEEAVIEPGARTACRTAAEVTVAGLVVARQRPATAKGVTFMLLEDEWGTINLVVPPPVYERHRLVVRTEPFVLARGPARVPLGRDQRRRAMLCGRSSVPTCRAPRSSTSSRPRTARPAARSPPSRPSPRPQAADRAPRPTCAP